MRKKDTSKRFMLNAILLATGIGSTVVVMAQGSTAQPQATQPNAIQNAVQQSSTAIGNAASAAGNAIDGLVQQSGSAISGVVDTIKQGGQVPTTGTGSPVISSGAAAAAGTVATTPVLPQVSQAQLEQAGCDAGIWAKMLQEYQVKAAEIAALETEQLVRQIVKATPPISSMASCFDQAANIINSATALYTTISKILTGGGLDSNQLLQYGKDLLTKYACSLVDSYIASTGIAGQINQVGALPGQILGTNVGVGGINTNVGGILTGGGYQQGQGGGIGQVSGNEIANTIGNKVNVPGLK